VAWLRRIVAGQAAKARRHHRAARRRPRRGQVPDSDGAPAAGASPSAVVREAEHAARLAAAAGALPQMRRGVLLRRVFDGQSFEEIANDLGCSCGAARVTWTRALRRLRPMLE